MSDLTDKWKKGELEYGYYYVDFLNGKSGVKQYGEIAIKRAVKNVKAPVPSYEEWQNMLKTIELNKQAAQKAKKMLSDWFNCANHKLKAYECISELNKITGEKK